MAASTTDRATWSDLISLSLATQQCGSGNHGGLGSRDHRSDRNRDAEGLAARGV